MAKSRERKEKRQARDKTIADRPAMKVYEKKSPDNGRVVHGSTMASGMHIEEQIHNPRIGDLPAFGNTLSDGKGSA